MSRTHRAFSSTVVVSVLGYAAQALSLVAIPLFLKTVGAEGYGLMVTVMAFMGYLTFADAGLSWGSLILVAQAKGRGDRAGIAHIVRHSAWLALGSGAVAALVLGAILLAARLGRPLPMFSTHPEASGLLLIAGSGLVLNLQFGIVYNLLHGLQEGYIAGAYQGGARLLGLAGAMLAAWSLGRVDAMLLVQVAVNCVVGLVALAHAWRRHPWAFQRGPWRDRSQYDAQLRVGAKNLLLQIGRTLAGTAPTLIISSVLGPAWVPFYTVPLSLLSLFFAPITSWSASMQSAYGEAWESGARDWVRQTYRLTVERAQLAGSLGVGLFLALGDRFIRWWTHDRIWLEPATALSIAAIALLGAWLAAGQFLLTGLNHHRQAAAAEVANGLLALFLAWLGVRWWGLPGVGPGLVAAALLTSVWVLQREVRGRLGDGCLPAGFFFLKAAAAAAACTVAAVLTSAAWPPAAGWRVALDLAAAGTAGLVAFAGIGLGLRLFAAADARGWALRLKEKLFLPIP